MSPDNSKPRNHFGRVAAARAKMQERAEEYVELHMKAAKRAATRGDAAPAEWALSHIKAVDEDGREIRPIAPSLDKPTVTGAGSNAPQILIGIGLGADFTALHPPAAVSQSVSPAAIPAQIIEQSDAPERDE